MSTRRAFFAALAAAVQARAAEKKNMMVRSARPEDLEMPFDGFDSWITPVERFFVRSHHYTPQVKVEEWRLKIGGLVEREQSLTIADLKALPRVETVAVLECAGNGRALYEPPMPGIQWEYGAVGNARWVGVRLADVLAKAGVKAGARDVLFDGADVPVGTMPKFQRTVPLKKCLAPETLLAYEMNGAPLAASHGSPLRLVVPGWAGDSWMKWVAGMRVIDQPFGGFYMATAYRHPGKPVRPGLPVSPEQMHPVESLRVKSLIASPVEDARVPRRALRIRGAAWGGEAPVRDVQVSMDRGRTWAQARLGREQSHYAWRLWEHTWTPPSDGHYLVMARATDVRGDAQPFAQEWNPSGYQHNVVHQVAFEVGAPEPPAPAVVKPAAAPLKQFEPPRNYRAACLTCHEEDIIMQQRLSRMQWEREVDKMVRWGARVNAADREPIVEYLLRLYGPRPRK